MGPLRKRVPGNWYYHDMPLTWFIIRGYGPNIYMLHSFRSLRDFL